MDGIQLGLRRAVGVEVAVSPGEVLAVVDGKVHVMQGVVGGAVDELFEPVAGDHVAVVDENGPHLDEDEEAQVEVLLGREDEDEDVVGQRLDVAVERVEGEGGPGRGHNPLVVRLVDVLVDAGVVLEAVDPVDEQVVPDHEDERGRDEPAPAVLVDARVQQTVAAHLGEEEGQRQDVDKGHRAHARRHLLPDLVLKEARMVLQPTVEDEVVAQGAEDPVQQRSANLGDGEDGDDLARHIVAGPRRAKRQR